MPSIRVKKGVKMDLKASMKISIENSQLSVDENSFEITDEQGNKINIDSTPTEKKSVMHTLGTNAKSIFINDDDTLTFTENPLGMDNTTKNDDETTTQKPTIELLEQDKLVFNENDINLLETFIENNKTKYDKIQDLIDSEYALKTVDIDKDSKRTYPPLPLFWNIINTIVKLKNVTYNNIIEQAKKCANTYTDDNSRDTFIDNFNKSNKSMFSIFVNVLTDICIKKEEGANTAVNHIIDINTDIKVLLNMNNNDVISLLLTPNTDVINILIEILTTLFATYEIPSTNNLDNSDKEILRNVFEMTDHEISVINLRTLTAKFRKLILKYHPDKCKPYLKKECNTKTQMLNNNLELLQKKLNSESDDKAKDENVSLSDMIPYTNRDIFFYIFPELSKCSIKADIDKRITFTSAIENLFNELDNLNDSNIVGDKLFTYIRQNIKSPNIQNQFIQLTYGINDISNIFRVRLYALLYLLLIKTQIIQKIYTDPLDFIEYNNINIFIDIINQIQTARGFTSHANTNYKPSKEQLNLFFLTISALEQLNITLDECQNGGSIHSKSRHGITHKGGRHKKRTTRKAHKKRVTRKHKTGGRRHRARVTRKQ